MGNNGFIITHYGLDQLGDVQTDLETELRKFLLQKEEVYRKKQKRTAKNGSILQILAKIQPKLAKIPQKSYRSQDAAGHAEATYFLSLSMYSRT